MPQIHKDENITRLKSIEEKLDKMSRRLAMQWMYSLGVGAMIGSIGIWQYSHLCAINVFFLGYALMLLPPIITITRKS